MNYEKYLFSQLLAIYSPEFAALPYDYQYNDIPVLYENFERSIYNKDNIDLYSCMITYFEKEYKNK